MAASKDQIQKAKLKRAFYYRGTQCPGRSLNMPFLFTGGSNAVPREIPSAKEYLCNENSNLYTTMRLSGGSGQVFELDMNLKRVKANAVESEMIKQMLKDLHMSLPNKDLRITLLRSNSNGFELIYEDMPKLEIQSCQVEIRLAKRENVQEKNSQWVKDRKVLEDSKLPESNEILLSDEEGNLYEGLSSNFFVIRSDGSLQTAPIESVLIGTVMKRVLKDWKYSEIVFEHPKISEIDNWKGAFITSTSRLILPIHKIIHEKSIYIIPLKENVEELRNIFATEIN